MNIISAGLSAQEQQTFQSITSMENKTPEKQGEELASTLGGRAFRIADTKWETVVTIIGMVAINVAKAADANDIQSMKAFSDDFASSAATWMTHSARAVTKDLASGLQQALSIALANSTTRNKALAKFNGDVQKSVMVDGEEVIIKTTNSEYSHQRLSPMSKRELSAQLLRLVDFFNNNPDGFSIF